MRPKANSRAKTDHVCHLFLNRACNYSTNETFGITCIRSDDASISTSLEVMYRLYLITIHQVQLMYKRFTNIVKFHKLLKRTLSFKELFFPIPCFHWPSEIFIQCSSKISNWLDMLFIVTPLRIFTHIQFHRHSINQLNLTWQGIKTKIKCGNVIIALIL